MSEEQKFEAAAEKLLNKLKQDPQFDLMQEYGQLLMRHIDSYTPEERKRYDELTAILTKKAMTEYQRKQYEDAANRYAALYSDQTRPFISGAFKSGCSHAHSKIEEAERDAWNRAIDKMTDLVSRKSYWFDARQWEIEAIGELKRLRK